MTLQLAAGLSRGETRQRKWQRALRVSSSYIGALTIEMERLGRE